MKNIKITSRVPEICKEKDLTRSEFIRRCLIHDVCGVDAAKRVYAGNVKLQFKTVVGVARLVLGVHLADAFIIN